MKRAHILLLVCAVAGAAVSAQEQAAKKRRGSTPAVSRIYKLQELNWQQIDALERERTLVLLPVGMLEQHGPHLPVGADTLGVLYEANGVSKRLSNALTDWNILMAPRSTMVTAAQTKWATC
jgi:hypothetical protein